MRPDEYMTAALRTECDQEKARLRLTGLYGSDHPSVLTPVRLNHAALTLTSEAGEIAGLVIQHLYFGKELDKTRLADEAGDLLWGLALLLDAAGLSFERVMLGNVAKLKVRYPDGWTDAAAADRGGVVPGLEYAAVARANQGQNAEGGFVGEVNHPHGLLEGAEAAHNHPASVPPHQPGYGPCPACDQEHGTLTERLACVTGRPTLQHERPRPADDGNPSPPDVLSQEQ